MQDSHWAPGLQVTILCWAYPVMLLLLVCLDSATPHVGYEQQTLKAATLRQVGQSPGMLDMEQLLQAAAEQGAAQAEAKLAQVVCSSRRVASS